MGGLVWALSKGRHMKDAIKVGQACSVLTLGSKENISPEITEEKLTKELEPANPKAKTK